jgi:hypothetical protein
MDRPRRWLFRHNSTFSDSGAVTGTGQTRTPSLTGTSGDIPFAHELGHQGGLGHGTPVPPNDDTTNGRPNHYSHINYLFQNYGIVETVNVGTRDDPEPAPFRFDLLNQLSFSDGRLPALDPYDVPEYCPLGRSVSYAPLASNVADPANGLFTTATNYNWPVRYTGGCAWVDWDAETRLTPAGETTEAPLWSASFERVRRVDASQALYALDQPPVMLRRGTDDLCVYRLTRTAQFGDTITQACAPPPDCSHLPASSGERWPLCELGAANSSAVALQDPNGDPIRVNGAFGATTVVRPDGQEVVVLVWRDGPVGLATGVLVAGNRLERVFAVPRQDRRSADPSALT